MTLVGFAAGAMLLGLVVYAVTGGADFGGGIWDLLARGPRARPQRAAIERALAPVWEANHVWLIFVLVVLYTAFPPAFAAIGIALHVPLTVLLIGIVLRGSAFVFRHYGGPGPAARRWGTVFAVSSTISPFFLGVTLGAITEGDVWWRPLPLAVGALTISAFAFLAAVYLTVEIEDAALRDDFRRRGLGAGAAMIGLAAAAALAAGAGADRFAGRLLGSWWTAPLIATTAAAGAGALFALARRRFRLARALAIATVTLLVVGWGAAQYPVLLAPDLTMAEAAAPPQTLRLLAPVIVLGSLVLLPSLWWLMRVFKADRDVR